MAKFGDNLLETFTTFLEVLQNERVNILNLIFLAVENPGNRTVMRVEIYTIFTKIVTKSLPWKDFYFCLERIFISNTARCLKLTILSSSLQRELFGHLTGAYWHADSCSLKRWQINHNLTVRYKFHQKLFPKIILIFTIRNLV